MKGGLAKRTKAHAVGEQPKLTLRWSLGNCCELKSDCDEGHYYGAYGLRSGMGLSKSDV